MCPGWADVALCVAAQGADGFSLPPSLLTLPTIAGACIHGGRENNQ